MKSECFLVHLAYIYILYMYMYKFFNPMVSNSQMTAKRGLYVGPLWWPSRDGWGNRKLWAYLYIKYGVIRTYAKTSSLQGFFLGFRWLVVVGPLSGVPNHG